MEDTGTLQSLTWLARAGKVDLRRVLVLRTASNFDQQRTGLTAAQSLAETKVVSYIAYSRHWKRLGEWATAWSPS